MAPWDIYEEYKETGDKGLLYYLQKYAPEDLKRLRDERYDELEQIKDDEYADNR